MDWVCKYMEDLELPFKKKSSCIQIMLDVIDHVSHQLAQEEIQTMLDVMEKVLMRIGSDGFPIRLQDRGIIWNDPLFQVIKMFNRQLYKKWGLGILE